MATNTWYDTFQASNGTTINTGTYTANSGGKYGNLTNQTLVDAVIESDSPYNSTTSFAFCLYSTQLQVDDPVQCVFNYNNGVTASTHIRLIYRAQSNGACYQVGFFGESCDVCHGQGADFSIDKVHAR